jgi:membrane associated rhomboid family serine protease
MDDDPREPGPGAGPDPAPTAEPDPELLAAGFVPPEPNEPPPVELWNAVGDVVPWGTMLVLLAWGTVFAAQAAQQEVGVTAALVARGANVVPHGVRDAAWRLLASTFLHESPSHVFFNAVTLLVLGQAVERIFARGGFPLLYVLGGAVASLGSLAWRVHRDAAGAGLSIGGSGVVFALGGALFAAAFRLRHHLAVGRARALGAVVLLLTLPSFSAGFQRHGTDNAAHAAGLLAGIVVGALAPLRERLGGPRRSGVVMALGVLSAIAMVATLVRVLAA